ncbi:MAG: class I SAM-dependent methyltransferase [Xanthomonadales bacterium]|nr:class I SAM-dependent methyltransferase [Xanthomonadales bacterium]
MQTNQHWTDYWARGCLTSLPQDFAGNYDGEIAEFWNEQFSAVPDGGRILDLCTGNGAVILLAARYMADSGKTLQLEAVDAARVNPEAVAAQHPDQRSLLPRIRFHEPSPVESLSLPDQSCDLVTSQYGIEYCDWEQAAAQISRLLRPGGRFALVSHAVSSDILKTMEKESHEYAVLELAGFFEATPVFLTGALSYRQYHTCLQQTLQRVEAAGSSPLLTMLRGTLTQILSLDEAGLQRHLDNLQRFYGEMRSGRDRLNDMLRVNRAIQQDPDWTSVFQRHGLLAAESGELLYRGRNHAGKFACFTRPEYPA